MRIDQPDQMCQVKADRDFSYALLSSCKLLLNLENLSQLITRRLKELDLSKSDLAKRIGKSRAYVTDLANATANTPSGQYRPSPEVLSSLAKNLKVSELEILRAAGFGTGSAIKKPTNIIEFLEALESMGLDQFAFSVDREALDGYTPEDFEELVERIKADVEITIRRRNK